jgi:hypothetical protein
VGIWACKSLRAEFWRVLQMGHCPLTPPELRRHDKARIAANACLRSRRPWETSVARPGACNRPHPLGQGRHKWEKLPAEVTRVSFPSQPCTIIAQQRRWVKQQTDKVWLKRPHEPNHHGRQGPIIVASASPKHRPSSSVPIWSSMILVSRLHRPPSAGRARPAPARRRPPKPCAISPARKGFLKRSGDRQRGVIGQLVGV